ncbi:hypothetical protein [Streptomyces sp. NPDC058086]
MQVIDSDYVTNCRKEMVERTADIEHGAHRGHGRQARHGFAHFQ